MRRGGAVDEMEMIVGEVKVKAASPDVIVDLRCGVDAVCVAEVA